MQVNCTVCKTPFEAKRTSAKFCSAKCRVKNYDQKENVKVEAQQEVEEIIPIPESEKKELVVTPKGELKTVPSTSAMKKRDEMIAKFNKLYGEGSIMVLGNMPKGDYEVVSTGSVGLDLALGIGGLPRGRIVEIFGPESSGKGTLCCHIIANAQKKKLQCLWVDAEQCFDDEYASNIGVDTDNLTVIKPDFGEQAMEMTEKMITAGLADVIVVDSVATLTPKGEIEKEMGDSVMGLHARLMSQALRKLVSTVSKTGALLIFINQLRDKIGVIWGSPETTTGGNALKFYSSIRIDVRRSTTTANSVIVDDIKEGNLTTVKVIKNKCAPPFRSAQFNIMYGKGIDKLSEILDIGIETEVLKKEGNTLSYKGTKLGVGKEQVKQFLDDNLELRETVEKDIIETLKK